MINGVAALGILAGALQVPEDIEIIEEPADEIKSEADTESSADEPPEEDVVDETTSEICHSVASLFRLTVAIQNLSSRDRMERMERIDKSAYESFDISHIREKHPLSEEGQYLTERLGKANTKRRQLLEYNEKHHEKIVGRRTEKEKEKEDVGEEDYAPIQTEAEEPPIDFHEHDYIPEAATSTVQTETSTVYGSSFRAFDTRGTLMLITCLKLVTRRHHMHRRLVLPGVHATFASNLRQTSMTANRLNALTVFSLIDRPGS